MRLAFVAGMIFLCASPGAFGQSAELGVGGGVNRISNSNLGSGYSLDGGFRINFGITLNSWRYFGYEFGYAYNRMELKTTTDGVESSVGKMAGHQGLFRFVGYATPEGKRIRPFASGGVHFTNFVPPGSSVTSGGGATKFGFNYGGGVKVQVAPNWMIRVDARQYQTGKPFDLEGASGLLRQNEFTVGVAFTL